MSTPPDLPPETRPASTRPSRPDAWRAEVGALRSNERRRRFPMGVHVGTPGGVRFSTEAPCPVPRGYDAGLRLDLVTGLLEGLLAGSVDGPIVEAHAWLTRPGDPVLHDRDLEWYSASVHAFAAYDVRLMRFRAVTRSGWFDVLTNEQRVWRRLRL